MDIATLSSLQSATNSQSSSASAALNTNFDAFLKMLITQMKNQDPTNPMDSNQFTQQLVQMSSVEQQIQTNKNLETLITSNTITNANSAVSLLGKQVEGSGTAALLQNGEAKWSFNLASNAPDTTVSVVNNKGATVYTEKVDGKSGSNSFTWDGVGTDGNTYEDGSYYLKVTANDSEGNSVASDTRTKGIVTAIDMSGTDPLLTINGAQIHYSEITGVSEPNATGS